MVQGLKESNPDLIVVQEVRLPYNTAQWLADELNFPHVYLSPKTGFEASREAVATISRLPFERNETLDLGGQQRVAQYVQVKVGAQSLVVANCHLFWQPGNSATRLRQAGKLIKWLREIPGNPPCVVCGDFNGTPETTAIELMRQHYKSAYAAIHGSEPDFTCPTPLPRSLWSNMRTFLGFFFLIRPDHLNRSWQGTLDYIFVDPGLKIIGCQIVLDQPAPDNPRIYPSDHVGILATIQVGE